jgi:hypothetical protein
LTIAFVGTIGIWSWMRTLPEGLMVLPRFKAATTSSGEAL